MNERKTHIAGIECDVVVAEVGLCKILGFPMDSVNLDPTILRVRCGLRWELFLLVTILALAAAFGASVVDDGPILGWVSCLVSLLHDALDDST